MKVAYPALIHSDETGVWVEFPDLDGCFSDGENIADAISNASDTLDGYLCSLMDRDISLPAASDAKTIDAGDALVSIIVTDGW